MVVNFVGTCSEICKSQQKVFRKSLGELHRSAFCGVSNQELKKKTSLQGNIYICSFLAEAIIDQPHRPFQSYGSPPFIATKLRRTQSTAHQKISLGQKFRLIKFRHILRIPSNTLLLKGSRCQHYLRVTARRKAFGFQKRHSLYQVQKTH